MSPCGKQQNSLGGDAIPRWGQQLAAWMGATRTTTTVGEPPTRHPPLIRVMCAAAVLALARCRLERASSAAGVPCDEEYQVLFTSGPDVLTEAAFGNRDVGGTTCTAAAGASAGAHGVVVVDPGALVRNSNRGSWRGESNSARQPAVAADDNVAALSRAAAPRRPWRMTA